MKIVDLRGKLRTHKTKRYKKRSLSDIRSFGIHHSLTETGSPEAFNNFHIDTNGWPGIAYTYAIQRDGTVYWCWDHDVVTYHVGNSNKHSLGICMIGDFRKNPPTPEQYKAALELVRHLQPKIPTAKEIKGHSEYPGYSWKSCPVIDMDKFRADVEGAEEDMQDVVLYVNGQKHKEPAKLSKEGRTYLPVSLFSGFTVTVEKWDNKNKTLHVRAEKR